MMAIQSLLLLFSYLSLVSSDSSVPVINSGDFQLCPGLISTIYSVNYQPSDITLLQQAPIVATYAPVPQFISSANYIQNVRGTGLLIDFSAITFDTNVTIVLTNPDVNTKYRIYNYEQGVPILPQEVTTYSGTPSLVSGSQFTYYIPRSSSPNNMLAILADDTVVGFDNVHITCPSSLSQAAITQTASLRYSLKIDRGAAHLFQGYFVANPITSVISSLFSLRNPTANLLYAASSIKGNDNLLVQNDIDSNGIAFYGKLAGLCPLGCPVRVFNSDSGYKLEYGANLTPLNGAVVSVSVM